MDKLNLNELGKLDDSYLILISPDDIELTAIDRLLNSNGVITGLIGSYEYICKEDNFVSILLKADEDTVVHRDKLNCRLDNNIYVCDYNNYANLKGKMEDEDLNEESDFNCTSYSSSTLYGYSDMKVFIEKSNEYANIVILIPFIGNDYISERMNGVFVSMYSALYKEIPEKVDINDLISGIVSKYRVSWKSLCRHSKTNFDMMMNYILSLLNVDKYATMESLSKSDIIKDLLK